MSARYTLFYTRRFGKAYLSEVSYSVNTFGADHASRYFVKIRKAILNLREHPFIAPPRGTMGQYRILNHIRGIHILYHVDKEKHHVTLIDICGDRRFYELVGQSADLSSEKLLADLRLFIVKDKN
jgi:plasmid stabilization system protein ParE